MCNHEGIIDGTLPRLQTIHDALLGNLKTFRAVIDHGDMCDEVKSNFKTAGRHVFEGVILIQAHVITTRLISQSRIDGTPLPNEHEILAEVERKMGEEMASRVGFLSFQDAMKDAIEADEDGTLQKILKTILNKED